MGELKKAFECSLNSGNGKIKLRFTNINRYYVKKMIYHTFISSKGFKIVVDTGSEINILGIRKMTIAIVNKLADINSYDVLMDEFRLSYKNNTDCVDVKNLIEDLEEYEVYLRKANICININRLIESPVSKIYLSHFPMYSDDIIKCKDIYGKVHDLDYNHVSHINILRK